MRKITEREYNFILWVEGRSSCIPGNGTVSRKVALPSDCGECILNTWGDDGLRPEGILEIKKIYRVQQLGSIINDN